jgi:2-succinyl-5-enolpyruvyl-6-hydroxy-3-cyclohexene-1-carboxylate synthase
MSAPAPAASDFEPDFRNTNALWCSVLVETLHRRGVRHAVIAPGSRSAPLAFAFARHPKIESVPVLDERSAAFFALGLARQHHRPVALICTSGTAAANFFPAVIEAAESGAPLVVLTADRPPELRACGAGQAIDQQKLYGGYVRFYHECAVPEASLDLLRYLRQTVSQACDRAREGGPVHLNCPFRDPLPPVEDGSTAALAGQVDGNFFAHLDGPPPLTKVSAAFKPATARGVIVAGPAQPRNASQYAARVFALAAKLGWPVLCDALSPLRHHAAQGLTRVACYDAILRNDEQAAALRPDFVLGLEGWPTSKVLRAWLAGSGAEMLLVSQTAAGRDALHGATRQLVLSPDNLEIEHGRPADPSYVSAWQKAETEARASLEKRLVAAQELVEPKATWLLARHLPAATPVFVASSMPVRDAEYFWPATKQRHRLHFNRGANGIDGTLSSALGVAHGGPPAVLLTGDLALLHDSNGFLLKPQFRGSLTIVLINNRGGGIFEHLPVAQFGDVFEKFFATPQEADFAKLCATHKVEHVPVKDWEQFTKLITTLPESGIRVLELRTDRKRDAGIRKGLLAKAAGAAG